MSAAVPVSRSRRLVEKCDADASRSPRSQRYAYLITNRNNVRHRALRLHLSQLYRVGGPWDAFLPSRYYSPLRMPNGPIICPAAALFFLLLTCLVPL